MSLRKSWSESVETSRGASTGSLLLFLGGDDLDLELFERVVEVVDLRRLEIELVERDGDLVGAQAPVLTRGIQQRLRVIRLEQVDDGLRCYGFLGCAHSVPPPGQAFLRCRTVPAEPDGRYRPNGSSLCQMVLAVSTCAEEAFRPSFQAGSSGLARGRGPIRDGHASCPE